MKPGGIAGMIVVAGYLRLRPGTFEEVWPHMQAMIAASRAETGCLAYSYGRDVIDPDIIRVYELWQGAVDLERHFASPHLKAWRARLAAIGIAGRELSAYAAGESCPV
jgi:quinol monooxygenase YgiN